MGKRTKLLSSIAVAIVLLGASPASAQYEGQPVHHTDMYSDATHMTLVGTIDLDYCTYYGGVDGGQFSLQGTYTTYQVETLVGYCSHGSFYPI